MDWRDKLGALKAELPQADESEQGTNNTMPDNAQLKSHVTSVSGKDKPGQQKDPLRVEMDKRKGKPATLITEFQGSDADLKELAKLLKVKCSSGGSGRDGEILIQGDFRKKIAEILIDLGYKVKRINF
jgi:translation initiation factor 1